MSMISDHKEWDEEAYLDASVAAHCIPRAGSNHEQSVPIACRTLNLKLRDFCFHSLLRHSSPPHPHETQHFLLCCIQFYVKHFQ